MWEPPCGVFYMVNYAPKTQVKPDLENFKHKQNKSKILLG
jgi:hypothetical protein